MEKKDKLIVGLVAVIILLVAAIGYLGFWPSGDLTLNITNDTGDQGITPQKTTVKAERKVCPSCDGKGYWICSTCGGSGFLT